MICPVCVTTHAGRKNGACPSCETQVEIVDGEWVVSAPNSSNVKLLEYFEKLVSRQQSAARGLNVVFQIPRKGVSYRHELSAAKRLIDRAGGLDKSLATIHLLLTDPEFAWKSYSSLLSIFKDFQLGLAIVEAKMEEAKKKELLTQEALHQMNSRRSLDRIL